MKHAMLDIETLGKGPKAVVLSAAVIIFNNNFEEITSRVVYFDVIGQVEKGRSIDASTVAWWMDQSVDARRRAFCQEHAMCEDSLRELSSAIRGCETVWAKSPQFDCTIMESLYADFGLEAPWHYREPRDLRTIVKLAAQASYEAPEFKGIEHDPLDDCRHQATELYRALKALGMDGKIA